MTSTSVELDILLFWAILSLEFSQADVAEIFYTYHENNTTELNLAGILFQDTPMYVPFNWC